MGAATSWWMRFAFLAGALAASADVALAGGSGPCDLPRRTNIGCVFYAVTLPNPILDQGVFQFAVELLNTSAVQIGVTVTGGGLASPLTATIGSNSVLVLNLPWIPALSTSTATIKVVGGGYRIVTTGPVVAVQLNPSTYFSGGANSFTNDGSLLLPEQGADTAFRAVTWPTWNGGGTQFPGHIAIVATQDATTVQVAASGGIQPGAGLGASGGSAILDEGDVLLVSSALDAPVSGTGSDLSGALITANRPVLVWTGHALANVPANIGFADHLEESLPPLSALSTDYFVVRPGNPAPGGQLSGARHFVKVVADTPTTLTTSPTVAGLQTSLGSGQSTTVEATVDFRLSASAPVLVAVFMEGEQRFQGRGDPSQSVIVPWRQAQRRMDFIAPVRLAPIWAHLVAPAGAAVSIDGTAVTGWTAIGTSGYSTAHFPLSLVDAHNATADMPFTLSVYAYPTRTSYWYPGGFELPRDIFRDGFEPA